MKAEDITGASDKLIKNILDRIFPSTIIDTDDLVTKSDRILDMLIDSKLRMHSPSQYSVSYDLQHQLYGACRKELRAKLVETYNLRQLDKIL